MFNLIARIAETLAARRMRKLSAAHAERRMQRLCDEAVHNMNAQIARNLRDRNEYPFHA